MISNLQTAPMAQAVGWALLHSAWQLCVVAVLLRGALILQRDASSLRRYWTAVGALILGVLLPVLTTVGVLGRLGDAGSAGRGVAAALPWVAWLPARSTAGAESFAAAGWAGRIATVLPVVTVLWLVAVCALSVRLALGWRAAQRLRRRSTRRLPVALSRRFYRLARDLGVRGVRFLESRWVDVPMVVGWLSPVVLIPASAVLRLAPHELASVVAHELAHVRRRDYLVNLIQTVVETALFFHPAVWWISNRIRMERECCCDDTAVSLCGSAPGYARALTELESLRAGWPRLAVGATDGDLLQRVRRLVRPQSPAVDGRRDLGGILVLLSSAVLFVGTGLSIAGPQQRPATAGVDTGEATPGIADVEIVPVPSPAPNAAPTETTETAEQPDPAATPTAAHGTLRKHARLEFRVDSTQLGSGGVFVGRPLSEEERVRLGDAETYAIVLDADLDITDDGHGRQVARLMATAGSLPDGPLDPAVLERLLEVHGLDGSTPLATSSWTAATDVDVDVDIRRDAGTAENAFSGPHQVLLIRAKAACDDPSAAAAQE